MEPPLRIGAIIWPGYECLFLARALGLLRGGPIKLVEYTTTPEAIRSFKNGALDVVAVTGDEFLRLASDLPELKAFLITDFSNGADVLIARKEFDCVRKLERKRIGVEVNATGVFILNRALSAVGMTKDEVEVVAIDNDRHAEAFRKGEVDAIVTFEPHRTNILKSGGRVLFDSSCAPGEQPDFLVARATTLEARLADVRMVAAAWFKAREVMLQQPLEAAAIVAPREGLTPAEFVDTLKLIALPSLQENRRLLTSKESELMLGLIKMHQVLDETGHCVTASPNLSLFTDAALP